MKNENRIRIKVIEETKFKDVGVSIRFLAPLKEETATARSLLAMLFCDYCEAYPSKQAMANHMDELYGMSFHASTMGYGKGQVLELKSRSLDAKYIGFQIDLLEEQFAFLHEVLFHPYLENNCFASKMVEEAKVLLLSKMQRMWDDPSSYSVHRALELVDKTAPISVSALGMQKQLESTTIHDLMNVYHQLLTDDEIEVIVCGNVKEERIIQLCNQYLSFEGTHSRKEHAYQVNVSKPLRRVEESKAISQTYLMLVYQTNIPVNDDRYWALKVANAILGQYPSSFLFQEVREKNSLCYSIFSNLISFDGALGITTGINRKDIDQALDLIHEQVKRVQEGDFSDELLETSKDLLYASIKSTKDEMASIMAFMYQNMLLDFNCDLNEVLSIIKSISRTEVIEAMNQIEEKLIYILSGEEEVNA